MFSRINTFSTVSARKAKYFNHIPLNSICTSWKHCRHMECIWSHPNDKIPAVAVMFFAFPKIGDRHKLVIFSVTTCLKEDLSIVHSQHPVSFCWTIPLSAQCTVCWLKFKTFHILTEVLWQVNIAHVKMLDKYDDLTDPCLLYCYVQNNKL